MPGLDAFLLALPKVELHCHLFGAVREQTFRDLVRRERAPIERRRDHRLLHARRQAGGRAARAARAGRVS
jgi:adenosine deaminase